MLKSPYDGKPVEQWENITRRLVREHPLDVNSIISIVLRSWDEILETKFGGYSIGRDINPKPQIIGFFLHELISLNIEKQYPGMWRAEKNAQDKDIVCVYNPDFSIEIKTSSSNNKIFGNRSYSQETLLSKKSKSGYYLAINFEKFVSNKMPEVTMIRFGWIDHEDWIGQKSSTGQQARLSSDVEKNKLLIIYSKEN